MVVLEAKLPRLTIFGVAASGAVVVEVGAKDRDVPEILIHRSAFLAGVALLEQAAVKQHVSTLHLIGRTAVILTKSIKTRTRKNAGEQHRRQEAKSRCLQLWRLLLPVQVTIYWYTFAALRQHADSHMAFRERHKYHLIIDESVNPLTISGTKQTTS